jgi:hypothetical protein
MFQKVKKMYAIYIIYVSLTDFPEPPLVLVSMFYIILNPTMILKLGVHGVLLILLVRPYSDEV